MRAGRQTSARCSRQRDELRRDLLPVNVEQEQRADRRAAPFGRAAGVENPRRPHSVGLRHVRVPVDDGAAIAETRSEPGLATDPRARNMDQTNPRLLDFDHAFLRQQLAQSRLVGIAPDGVDRRPQRAQLVEHRNGRDVAGMKDPVSGPQQLEALVGESPRTPRQMGVGDDRDSRQPTPFKNFPSR